MINEIIKDLDYFLTADIDKGAMAILKISEHEISAIMALAEGIRYMLKEIEKEPERLHRYAYELSDLLYRLYKLCEINHMHIITRRLPQFDRYAKMLRKEIK